MPPEEKEVTGLQGVAMCRSRYLLGFREPQQKFPPSRRLVARRPADAGQLKIVQHLIRRIFV
jgi:hypothetical protein